MKAEPSANPRLFSATAIGKMVGVSGRTILNWESSGLIVAAVRVGRVVRFDSEDVMKRLTAATRCAAEANETLACGTVNDVFQPTSSIIPPGHPESNVP